MEKPADVQYPIIDVIKRRWSPRAFSNQPVEVEKMHSLFEAARWSASSFNEQPWRFIVATQDQPEAFAKALSCLVEANQAWAKYAPVLVLTAIKDTFTYDGSANRVALHDLGAAMASLSLQALELGLFVHQMAGVNQDRMREAYNIPEGFTPQTAAAIGYAGDMSQLPDDLRGMEEGQRDRKAFGEFVFADSWGNASSLF